MMNNQMMGMNLIQMIQSNPAQIIQYARQNIGKIFMQRKFNVPQDIMNDPDAITQYLLSTKQITQDQVNFAYQQAQKAGFRR
jgi:hypothetical protein